MVSRAKGGVDDTTVAWCDESMELSHKLRDGGLMISWKSREVSALTDRAVHLDA